MDDVLLDDSFEEQAQNQTVHYHYTEFIYPAKILAIFPSQLEKILHQFDSPTCTLECMAEERKKIQPIFTILVIK